MSLREYRRKRDFAVTAEPRGKSARPGTALIFVVQHHWASHEHYDFRLELDGVLKSWAVPKGPSTESHVKRLAVEVEDHPLPYASFQGRIPAGQYGAGTVKIWDRGTWEPEGDPHAGLKRGELVFALQGRKLKGRWALIRMKPSERYPGKNNWLLFSKGAAPPVRPANKARALRSLAAKFVAPELATLADAPPEGEGWVHETKLDGYRIQALIDGGTVRLLTRSGKDWTDRFPSVQRALEQLPINSAILDGEVVALDAKGQSSFQRLQSALEDGAPRARLQYSVFDLLQHDGQDLRPEPLSMRRQALQPLLGRSRKAAVVQLTARLKAPKGQLLALACRLGLEGVVSKRNDAPYESRRSRSWIKSKCGRRQELIVVGFTEPRGGRSDLGALLLGVIERGKLIYAGKVGTGFDRDDRATLRRKLDALERKTSPLARPPVERPAGTVHWVRPALVAEIGFTEWTVDGLLRHPVFHGLREDKPVRAVRREQSKAVAVTSRTRNEPAVRIAGMPLTHPDRLVYPDIELTKADLARYYERVAPLMLPHLAGRPLSLLRCPEGQGGACFYQKHWESHLPGIEVVPIPEDGGARKPYAVVHEVKGLIALVQYGVMEFHPWGSRADKLEAPDRIILDLDPASDVSWQDVRKGALALKALIESLGLAAWLKTSGGKGLHIVVPVERRTTWELAAGFAAAVAGRLAAEHPDRYVTVASKTARTGKIFIDHLRNGRGATAVAAWSTRARAGAPVSMPLAWDALKGLTGGDQFGVAEVMALLKKPFSDPWADLAGTHQRITRSVVEQLTSG